MGSKPVSRPHELGRAIGYDLNPGLLLEKLKRMPLEQWSEAKSNRALVEYAGSARGMGSSKQLNTKRVWLVVKLERNVPVLIDAYTDKRSATRREKFLRSHMRAELDEVRVMQLRVGS